MCLNFDTSIEFIDIVFALQACDQDHKARVMEVVTHVGQRCIEIKNRKRTTAYEENWGFWMLFCCNCLYHYLTCIFVCQTAQSSLNGVIGASRDVHSAWGEISRTLAKGQIELPDRQQWYPEYSPATQWRDQQITGCQALGIKGWMVPPRVFEVPVWAWRDPQVVKQESVFFLQKRVFTNKWAPPEFRLFVF